MAAVIGLGIGCGGASSAPVVSPADVSRASSRWPGTDQAQLDAGRSLYLERCSSCHVPVDPASITADAWPGHVEEMRGRARLDDDEVARIQRYLITIASRT